MGLGTHAQREIPFIYSSHFSRRVTARQVSLLSCIWPEAYCGVVSQVMTVCVYVCVVGGGGGHEVSFKVLHGSEVTLTCASRGEVTLTVLYVRGEVTLTVLHVRGEVTCTVLHVRGEVTLTVLHGVRGEVTLTVLHGVRGVQLHHMRVPQVCIDRDLLVAPASPSGGPKHAGGAALSIVVLRVTLRHHLDGHQHTMPHPWKQQSGV
jgi:hypothetical protein